MTAAAEKLPHQPFDAISRHRVAHLAADRDAQSGLSLVIGLADNDEVCRVNLLTCLRESQELGSFSQAGRFRKFFPPFQRHPRLLGARPFRRRGNCESFPSLRPAPLQHITPAGCLHTGEKTMRPFSSDIARLIGSLHGKFTPLGRLAAKYLYES